MGALALVDRQLTVVRRWLTVAWHGVALVDRQLTVS
jgi:hypothetical protein